MVGFGVLLQPFRVPTLLAQHFVHPWPPYESLTDSLVARIPRPARLKHAAAAIVCLLTMAAQASAAPSCRVPGGHTVATDRIARLIGVPTPVGNALYACIRRTGRKVPLDISYSDARLAGRWAAWQRHENGRWRIAVRDLRSGRQRLIIGHVAEDALFLTTTGTAVWAQLLPSDVGVFANSLAGDGRLLGRGAVEPASLRVRGRHVSWRAGGSDYTADVR